MQVIKKRPVKSEGTNCLFVTTIEEGEHIKVSGPAKITLVKVKPEGHLNHVTLSVEAPADTRIDKR